VWTEKNYPTTAGKDGGEGERVGGQKGQWGMNTGKNADNMGAVGEHGRGKKGEKENESEGGGKNFKRLTS